MTQTWVSSFHKASAKLISLPTQSTLNPLPAAQVGVSYSAPLTGFGGLPPYTFSVGGSTGGNTWGIVGANLVSVPTPSTQGPNTITLNMTDAAGNAAPPTTYSLSVGAGPVITAKNPIGTNLAAGGAAAYSYEGLPNYQDHTRSGRFVNNMTASIASNGVLTVTAIAIPGLFVETQINGGGVPAYARIVQQLSGPAGGAGTYQLNTTGATVSSRSMSFSQPVDAAGWPTTDFTFLLSECSTAFPWANGKFACGFTSKGTGTEIITGNNCTISGQSYNPGTGVVSFDVQPTNAAAAYTYTVMGTTGGVTNMFNWLPAYRQSGYNPNTLITTEAINTYSQFPHLRGMFHSNAWYDAGEQWALATPVTIGATSATLATPWKYAPGTYIIMFMWPVGQAPDVRSVTITATGQTVITWVGGLGSTYPAYNPATAYTSGTMVQSGGVMYQCIAANTGQTPPNAAFWNPVTVPAINIQNSAANRHTPANTKTRGFWQASALSYEGYPLEWLIDQCIICGINPYVCLPPNADASYFADVFAMIATKLGVNAALNLLAEIGNEMWNGAFFGGASAMLMALANFNGLNVTQQLATILHTAANAARAAFGTAKFNSNVQMIAAWQAGQTGFFYNLFAYYDSQGWVPSADLTWIFTAPYFNTSTTNNFTASIDNTGKMTVTACQFPNIAAGATVTGPNVPANSIINSQLSITGAAAFGTGTYQLSTSGVTVASELMSCSMALNSTVAQLEANLTLMAAHTVNYNKMESLTVLALSRGLKCGTYEDGWQLNAENSGLINGGATALDSGQKSIMIAHYNALFDGAGVQLNTNFDGGVFGANNALSPVDAWGVTFPPTAANSPRLAAIFNFSGGLPTPVRNAITGVGSIIPGQQFCDNTAPVNGNFALVGAAPRVASTGYVPYRAPCTAPGNYNLDVTFSNVVGTVTTDVEVNGVVLATGVSVPAGAGPTVVRVLSGAPLNLGQNYILLGHNGAQTATVNQIQTN